MLRRVAARQITHPLKSPFAYPKTALEKRHEIMDEVHEGLRYKRLSRAPSTGTPKLKSLRRRPDSAISRTLSFILRHGAVNQGLAIRPDGFVKVMDLLALPQFSAIDFAVLERVVKEDEKNRYALQIEPDGSSSGDIWWIRANQGHSLRGLDIEMTPITKPDQIPMAVHGTSKEAWSRISIQGLSRMRRQHIHFAKGLAGPNVVSGMRGNSQVYIYLNVPLALRCGLELSESANGVVLCPGDDHGIISPRFFGRVEWAGNRQPLVGWEGPSEPIPPLEESETQADVPSTSGAHPDPHE